MPGKRNIYRIAELRSWVDQHVANGDTRFEIVRPGQEISLINWSKLESYCKLKGFKVIANYLCVGMQGLVAYKEPS